MSTSNPSRPSTWRLALLLAPFAFLGGMIADRAVSFAEKAPPPAASTYKQLDLFARVLSYVENNYVESVDTSQLIYGAIKGMMDTLDPHTLFMPPEMFKDMKVDTSGEFGGLGIEIAEKNEVLTVVTPIDDTPASRAGLKPGDQLLRIDGEGTRELGVAGAIKKSLDAAGIGLADVDKLFLHQANGKMDEAILTALYDLYEMPQPAESIMPMTISWLGNSSVATIPTMLDLILKGRMEGQSIRSGQILVFASVGAGMHINAAVYRVP